MGTLCLRWGSAANSAFFTPIYTEQTVSFDSLPELRYISKDPFVIYRHILDGYT